MTPGACPVGMRPAKGGVAVLSYQRLEAFCDVIDLGSLTAAAGKRFVTQPVVSRMLAGLEDHFGAKLLQRVGRRLVATEQGWVVYRLGKEVIRAERDARQLIQDLNRGDVGLVSVALTDAIGTNLMPDVWAGFSSHYPKTTLALRIHDSETVISMVVDGSVDLGVVIAQDIPIGLAAEPLGTWSNVLVAPPGHRLAGMVSVKGTDLQGECFLCAAGEGHGRLTESRLHQVGLFGSYRIMQFGNTETIRRAVARGVGLAFLSDSAVQDDLASGQLCALSLEGPATPTPVVALYLANLTDRPLQTAFRLYLREYMAKVTT